MTSRAFVALAAALVGAPLAAAAQQPAARAGAAAPASVHLVTTPAGNEARYRVREQLARLDFPNDAIGKTTQVQGRLVVRDGAIVRDSSRFVVNVASLESDAARRDNYVRRNTLQTDAHPNVVFVPTSARGLPPAAQRGTPGQYTFELLGDLTIRGVTRPAAWQVTARVAPGGAVTGTATTSFTFADFQMTKPRVASVLSVDETIKLEYDFALVPDGNAAP